MMPPLFSKSQLNVKDFLGMPRRSASGVCAGLRPNLCTQILDGDLRSESSHVSVDFGAHRGFAPECFLRLIAEAKPVAGLLIPWQTARWASQRQSHGALPKSEFGSGPEAVRDGSVTRPSADSRTYCGFVPRAVEPPADLCLRLADIPLGEQAKETRSAAEVGIRERARGSPR